VHASALFEVAARLLYKRGAIAGAEFSLPSVLSSRVIDHACARSVKPPLVMHGPPEEAGRLRVDGGFNVKGSLLVVETCMVGIPPSDGHMSRFNFSLAVARAGSFSSPRMSQSRTGKARARSQKQSSRLNLHPRQQLVKLFISSR
jgi:hypothetical protein